jgi:hypothetical protein
MEKFNKKEYDFQRREVLRKYAYNYLLANPCIDCGESRIACLQFDHRIPSEKRYTIGLAIKNRVAVATLQKEIDKCDVRCANCHAIRTAYDQGWYVRIEEHPEDENERLFNTAIDSLVTWTS